MAAYQMLLVNMGWTKESAPKEVPLAPPTPQGDGDAPHQVRLVLVKSEKAENQETVHRQLMAEADLLGEDISSMLESDRIKVVSGTVSRE